ncbi:MAG: MFS transporter [Candidatus Dormiibacterota bacterium]
MSRRLGIFAPLRHRGFRFLVAGQLTSNVGDMVYAVALPWYVLANHGGVLLLGLVLAAYGIPRTVLIPVGGHVSDRWRPWTVMLAADGVRAVVVIVLAIVVASGRPNAFALVPIAVVLGAGEGMFLPGSFSIIPSLLGEEDLQAGNALASSGTQLATLIGPAVGGVLVALLGPSPAFGLDGLSFIVSALTLAAVRAEMLPRQVADTLMRGPAPVPVGENSGPSDIARKTTPDSDGHRPTMRQLVSSERALQIILLISIAANLGVGAESEVALPALAHGPFHAGAGGYGALVAAFGAGALLGTIAAGQARPARRPAMVGSVAFLLDAVSISVVPFLGGPVGAGAAMVAFGALNGFGNVVTITAFQRWAPPALIGRLMGLLLLTSFGLFPVSVALGAVVVHHFGPAVLFPVAGAALGVAILFGLTQRRWREFGVSGTPAPFALLAEGRSPSE